MLMCLLSLWSLCLILSLLFLWRQSPFSILETHRACENTNTLILVSLPQGMGFWVSKPPFLRGLWKRRKFLCYFKNFLSWKILHTHTHKESIVHWPPHPSPSTSNYQHKPDCAHLLSTLSPTHNRIIWMKIPDIVCFHLGNTSVHTSESYDSLSF